MIVGFTTTCAHSAYHHLSCEFEPHSLRGVLDTTSCDKDCQLHVTGWWFSLDTLVPSTNKTDRHDITEILLKVKPKQIMFYVIYQDKYNIGDKNFDWYVLVKGERGILFYLCLSVRPSVRPRYFSSHFSQ
jgi:hypothetical protein